MGLVGHMPVNPQLPNPWYDTPTFTCRHSGTSKNFVKHWGFILDKDTSNLSGKRTWLGTVWPNLFGDAVYRLTKEP